MDVKKYLGIGIIVLGISLIFLFGSIKTNFDAHGIFLCEAVSANPNLDMNQCPAHTSIIPTLVSIGYVISSLLILAGILVIFMEKLYHQSAKTSPKVNLDTLDQEEKKIYHILKDNQGSMYQSDLIKETGFSKVQMTRVLDKLEGKKICDRKRRGMTNIVILK